MCISFNKFFLSLLVAYSLPAGRSEVHAQQANYRASISDVDTQCRFGTILTSKGNWHDENPSDQLILGQVSSIAIQLKTVGQAICFSDLYDRTDDQIKILINANANKQRACETKFRDAMRNYKLSAAVYFSSKELEAEQRIMNLLSYSSARNDATTSAVSGIDAFEGGKEKITDRYKNAKDAKKIGSIAALLIQNHKSAAVVETAEFISDKAGDKLKDVIKRISRDISVAYLDGKLMDWQNRTLLEKLSDSSSMECN